MLLLPTVPLNSTVLPQTFLCLEVEVLRKQAKFSLPRIRIQAWLRFRSGVTELIQ
ncbi:hypothetical protein BGX31_004677, partial [Mortierella sp. GBA43]